ncbi:hypothetical protein BJ170DRAFT_427313 [Xylariales sp. AK1849]|nr:hypothetical protein BJ170DRAFT_427313 [Xylariales sp. AK1849]
MDLQMWVWMTEMSVAGRLILLLTEAGGGTWGFLELNAVVKIIDSARMKKMPLGLGLVVSRVSIRMTIDRVGPDRNEVFNIRIQLSRTCASKSKLYRSRLQSVGTENPQAILYTGLKGTSLKKRSHWQRQLASKDRKRQRGNSRRRGRGMG